MAIAAGGGVFQVRFEPGERGCMPMFAPFDAGRLIELEFVFQIFAHARHDQQVQIAGDDLCRPRTRARPRHGPGRRAAAATGSSQTYLNKVARQLNQRPRKTLTFETPAERFNACVASTG